MQSRGDRLVARLESGQLYLSGDRLLVLRMTVEQEQLRSEVERKIGRNLILFQEVEILLKVLICSNQCSGYAGELKKLAKQKREKLRKVTLGNLVKRFFKELFNQPNEEQLPENIEEPHISFCFVLEKNGEAYANWEQEVYSLVEERNQLAHELPLRWDLYSIKGLRSLNQHLDQQYSKIQATRENLTAILQGLEDCIKDFSSQEFADALLKQMLQNKLIWLLWRIEETQARADGWTLLNHAGSFIKEKAPEELDLLKQQQECKTLKQFILATEAFEIWEEPTPRGGTRTLYRTKPELHASNAIPG